MSLLRTLTLPIALGLALVASVFIQVENAEYAAAVQQQQATSTALVFQGNYRLQIEQLPTVTPYPTYTPYPTPTPAFQRAVIAMDINSANMADGMYSLTLQWMISDTQMVSYTMNTVRVDVSDPFTATFFP